MRNPRRRLYVAYGSNLNLEQMRRRCPTAKAVGATVLRNWRLVFKGVATIERHMGSKVPVLVWDIQPEDEAALDIYEGWPRLYRKEPVRVTLDGKQVRAMAYVMNGGRKHPPSQLYYDTILEGYIDAGFDVRILMEAANQSKRRKTAMTATIIEQILAIRDTGETNMFDVNMVMRIADREGYYELVSYLADNRREYSRFILTGESREDA